MSGGHFDYQQYHIDDIANSIEDYLEGHELDECDVEEYINDRWLDDDEKKYIKKHKRTVPNRYGYDKETVKEMKRGLAVIRKAYVYAQRIDWMLSGDDGEESFKERLKEELDELKKKK